MSWLSDAVGGITNFIGNATLDMFNPETVIKSPLKSALLVDPTWMAVNASADYVWDKFQEMMPKAPEMPVAPKDNSAALAAAEAAAEAAAQAEADLTRKRAGLNATIMTGPQGVTVPADTFKTTLG